MSRPTSPETTSGERGPVLVGLGSNIEPAAYLPRACRLLGERVEVLAVSAVYLSPAVGSPGSPPFWNAAARLATGLPPAALKREVLRPIEAALGRVRTADKSAPRTIDLDLVLYGSLVLDDPAAGLVLPHPDLLTHAYVALPAADLAPDLRHPLTGEPLRAIAERLRFGAEIEVVPGWETLPVS